MTTDADRAEIRKRFGLDDLWPAVCEPYTQWVLQDTFTDERPTYEQAGVQLVGDVEPYELMKLRLLNGSHQAMAYFAYLAGYRLVHEAAQDPLFRSFLLGYMDCEATPTLPPLPGVDLQEYKHTLIERFSDPQIRDTIARLCAQGSDRIPKWILPVIRQQLATGGELWRSAAVVAGWARYAEGVDDHGEPIEVVDRLADSSPGGSARTPTRSSPTAACSGTSPTTYVSAAPTGPHLPHCTSVGREQRWSHWSDDRIRPAPRGLCNPATSGPASHGAEPWAHP